MKDILKKGVKGVTDLGSNAVKNAVSAVVGDIIKEIMDETGVADIAKDKMMDVGLKVFSDMGMDPKSIQRDLIKTAIRKELNI